MEWQFFLQGMVLGFSIAAPVGPIGLLCIQRTLNNGLLNGFFSGLGTATADAFYGFIAAFGITAVSSFLISGQMYLHLLGGVFLLYLGYTTFRKLPAAKAANLAANDSLGRSYASAFFLTLSNPLTIMSFAAVFSGLGIRASRTWSESYAMSALVVSGVFLGSFLWWLLLSGVVTILRSRFNQAVLHWINRFSGVIIALFGIWNLATL